MDRLLDKELKTVIKTLKNIGDLKKHIEEDEGLNVYNSFLEYFVSLPKVNEIDISTLYKRAEIERSYCYHIMNGKKVPGRDKILRLCIAAGLTLYETQLALEAGKVAILSVMNTRDIVIAYAITAALNVQGTNELLIQMNQEFLS